MFDDLQHILASNCLLVRSQPILIGVSGGADSLTLLDILVRSGYQVVVAHFNHLLRPEASDDARVVERVAETLNTPFVLGTGSTLDFAREQGFSIEEAAREMRYRFLFDQAEKYDAQAVAVAHNANDQVETVLMHLLRGAGLDGLTGMSMCFLPNPWSETIPLIRPLLNIWRAEIETYCAEHDLTTLTDSTNADTTYFRNRLRHELIPELETYVPGFCTRLHQTADLLTADRALLEELTDQVWFETIKERGPGFVTLHPSSFTFHPLALRRRLIRRAVSHLRPGARDIDFALVQRVLAFADKPTATGQTDLGLGLRIALENDRLTISDWQTAPPTAHWPQTTDHYLLSIPGQLDLGSGWQLQAEIPADFEAAKREAQENCNSYQAWVDLGEKQPILNIRPRLSGDRFQPLGMGEKSMKISDFMINEKIPQRARVGWPLVCSGDEIVWVPGFRLAHPYRITEKSQQIVKLALQTRLVCDL